MSIDSSKVVSRHHTVKCHNKYKTKQVIHDDVSVNSNANIRNNTVHTIDDVTNNDDNTDNECTVNNNNKKNKLTQDN